MKIQERTKKGESNNDSLTMGRAHTFPLPTKLSAATLQERRAGTWTTTVEVVPHASAAEQWVCYSRLAPWSSNEDGPCELGSSGAAADKAREVNAADCYFGGGEALQAPQGRWSMHVETAGRRRITLDSSDSTAAVAEKQGGGQKQEHVPIVMLQVVVYNEEQAGPGSDSGPEPADMEAWTQLDFGVFEPSAHVPSSAATN